MLEMAIGALQQMYSEVRDDLNRVTSPIARDVMTKKLIEIMDAINDHKKLAGL